MQLFKVVTSNGDLNVEGKTQYYTKNQAAMKAHIFEGKIQPVGRDYSLGTIQVLTLDRNQISNELLGIINHSLVDSTPSSINTTRGDMYASEVFIDNLCVNVDKLTTELKEEFSLLGVLANDYDYVYIPY